MYLSLNQTHYRKNINLYKNNPLDVTLALFGNLSNLHESKITMIPLCHEYDFDNLMFGFYDLLELAVGLFQIRNPPVWISRIAGQLVTLSPLDPNAPNIKLIHKTP